uniref:Uncharacterized protein n=1 Tax=Anguilla anguilla TaxID=7936 RepID=A0A0E9S4M9_ANGAN
MRGRSSWLIHRE